MMPQLPQHPQAGAVNILRSGLDVCILQPVYGHTSVADVKYALTKMIPALLLQMLLYYKAYLV